MRRCGALRDEGRRARPLSEQIVPRFAATLGDETFRNHNAFFPCADEPLPADSPLWGAPRVIITPHVSGDFPGYMDRIIPLFCENLGRYLAGQPLLNVVDTALGY